jgi:branched-chain amino acid transport system permease protein
MIWVRKAISNPGLLTFLIGAFATTLLAHENRFAAFVIGLTFIYILWSAGVNLLYGYIGLMPMIVAGIGGISAYSTAALMMRWHWSFWLAMPLSAFGAALIGAPLALPSLKMKGFYFALCTVVIQTVMSLGFVYFGNLTNGDTGIAQIPLPDVPFGGGAVIGGVSHDLMLALFAWLAVFGIWIIIHSPLGWKFVAIREDEVLANALGIDVVKIKLIAFFIASLYAGVGGALYATHVGFISPRAFDILTSINLWLMVAFGGRATIPGPIIGSILLVPTPYLLQDYHDFKDVIYGILIIMVIVLMPTGVYGELRRRFQAMRLATPTWTLALLRRFLP